MYRPRQRRAGEEAAALSAIADGDQRLIQIVDEALADAARRSGEWLVCGPGCHQCCVGAFAINRLDAVRLRTGLADLTTTDRERAHRIRKRAADYILRVRGAFPGDAATGILDDTEAGQQGFEEFANDEPCPALDPASGTCDLYAARPMTCRAFGTPIRSEEGLGVCELCFHGASDEQIASCEMVVDPDAIEEALLALLGEQTARERTIVAYCLVDG